MEDFNTLQARREQMAMKNRSRPPGAVLSSASPTVIPGAAGPGAFGGSASGTFSSSSFSAGPMGGLPGGATAVSFGTPAFGTANQAGYVPVPSTPPSTPPSAVGVNFGNAPPAALLSTSSSSSAVPPPLGTNNPNAQMQMTNAQRIAAQLQAFGLADMVAVDGNARPLTASSSDDGSVAADAKRRLPAHQQIPSDIREFLTFVPRHGLFQCYIKREKSFGFGGGAKYRLYTQKDNRFLLSCRKRNNKPTSNYLISMDEQDMERTSANFLGKVRANFTGLEFVIYDSGESPASGKTPVRCELGAVFFEQNIGGVKGPRKIKAVIPSLNADDKPAVWQPASDSESILEEYKRDQQSGRFIVLQNKAPTWNEQLRAYQLNFNGRVTASSVKNFQLCDARNPSRVVLQFGKCEDNKFALDYQYPLTAFQAFAIAMTSFDNKLACD